LGSAAKEIKRRLYYFPTASGYKGANSHLEPLKVCHFNTWWKIVDRHLLFLSIGPSRANQTSISVMARKLLMVS
jgi:hypothetical protein